MKTEVSSVPGATLSDAVVHCCREVYRRLGPGFSKATYEEALCYELTLKRLAHQRRVEVPLFYRGTRLSACSVVELMVAERVIVDVRAVDELLRTHRRELGFRLRMTGISAGLLVNFSAPEFADGIVLIHRRDKASSPPQLFPSLVSTILPQYEIAVAS